MPETDTMKALAQMMQEFTKSIQALKPSPEEFAAVLREANKPYVDPASVEREKRERARTSREYHEAKKRMEAMQAKCPHKDKNDKNALNIQHNFPDAMPRGICPLCTKIIHPAHWEIAAPTVDHPEGKAFIVPEDPQYHLVLEKEAMAA